MDEVSGKQFAVVSLLDKNTPEVIPCKWIVSDFEARWPPQTSVINLIRLIKSCASPENNWETVAVKIYYMTNSFSKASVKLQLVKCSANAGNKSNSKDGLVPRNSRKRKVPARYIEDGEPVSGKLFSNDSDTYERGNEKLDRACQSSDIDSDQSFNKKEMKTEVMALTPLPNFGSDDDEIMDTASSTPQGCSTPVHDLPNFTSGFKTFERTIFKRLTRIEQTLEILVEKISSKEGIESNQLLDFEGTPLPLTNMERLYLLEEKLKDCTFYTKLVNSLRVIGGNDLQCVTYALMKRLLVNEVAEQFSWAGAKQKLPFKDLTMSRVIFDTVRYHIKEVTEIKISDVIAKWLVQAKLRKQREEEKRKRNSSS